MLNISYDRDLMLLHFVLAASHGATQERVDDILNGRHPVIALGEDYFERLASAIERLVVIVQSEKTSFDSEIRDIAELASSTTGNGFYLYRYHGVGA